MNRNRVLRYWACILAACLTSFFVACAAQKSDSAASQRGADSITSDEVRVMIDELSSEEMLGRHISDGGYHLAVKWAEQSIRDAGLTPIESLSGYRQDFMIKASNRGDHSALFVTGAGAEFSTGTTIFVRSLGEQTLAGQAEAIFLTIGPGNIQLPDELSLESVAGKLLFVVDVTPPLEGPEPEIIKALAALDTVAAHIDAVEGLESFIGDLSGPTRTMDFADATMSATTRLGFPKGQFVPTRTYIEMDAEAMVELARSSGVSIPEPNAGAVAAIAFSTTPVDFQFEPSPAKGQTYISSNVLGYLEGSDPVLKDEVVIIGAHLDHLGVVENILFPGADDNASGVAALLEVAEAFQASGKSPKRSVLFILFGSEETGLLGSRFYGAQPVLPLKDTVAMINLDSISRSHMDNPEFAQTIFIDGADCAPSIERALSLAVLQSDLIVQPLHEGDGFSGFKTSCEDRKKGLGAPSDHVVFGQSGVESVLLSSGIHGDYHSPNDISANTDPVKVADVASLTFRTSWLLANDTVTPTD